MKMSLVGRSMGLALAFTLVGTAATEAADSQRLTFTIHAAFCCREPKQPKPVDPHVFVQDPASPAASGPQQVIRQCPSHVRFTPFVPKAHISRLIRIGASIV